MSQYCYGEGVAHEACPAKMRKGKACRRQVDKLPCSTRVRHAQCSGQSLRHPPALFPPFLLFPLWGPVPTTAFTVPLGHCPTYNKTLLSRGLEQAQPQTFFPKLRFSEPLNMAVR